MVTRNEIYGIPLGADPTAFSYANFSDQGGVGANTMPGGMDPANRQILAQMANYLTTGDFNSAGRFANSAALDQWLQQTLGTTDVLTRFSDDTPGWVTGRGTMTRELYKGDGNGGYIPTGGRLSTENDATGDLINSLSMILPFVGGQLASAYGAAGAGGAAGSTAVGDGILAAEMGANAYAPVGAGGYGAAGAAGAGFAGGLTEAQIAAISAASGGAPAAGAAGGVAGAGGAAAAGGGAAGAGSVLSGLGGGGGGGLYGSLLSTGASLVGQYLSSEAAKDAANTAAGLQTNAANAGIAEQRRQFDAIQTLLKPYVTTGTGALTGMGNLAGLNGNPAQQAAIDAIKASPQFTSALAQGENSILSNASATGGLRGGNVQAALGQFSPALLSQAINDQYGRLGGLTQLGQNSAVMQGNAGMSTGNSITQLLQQIGAAQAGGALANGKAEAGWGTTLAQLGGLWGGMLNKPAAPTTQGGF